MNPFKLFDIVFYSAYWQVMKDDSIYGGYPKATSLLILTIPFYPIIIILDVTLNIYLKINISQIIGIDENWLLLTEITIVYAIFYLIYDIGKRYKKIIRNSEIYGKKKYRYAWVYYFMSTVLWFMIFIYIAIKNPVQV